MLENGWLTRSDDSENLSKFNSLKKSIHAILSSQMMTTRELVSCLMSEPYNIAPGDLDLIRAALNYLMAVDALQVVFRTNKQSLDAEALFIGRPLSKFHSRF